ncbi:MAG TPA: SAM-dependent methyltransferase [Steroidobacteraceae bacterium]|nr:SAM-dependent methyltransferase [Steroidobacteraceae bacterium]
MSSPIRDVSDTAFWIAWHRALESERPDALFRDPFAARLAGERGKAISEAMPTSTIVAWTVVLRTRIIDDFIAFAIESGTDTILNLGAGLDARPYRMGLPETLRWIEADYPHIIDYKEDSLRAETPHCRLERVKIDLADESARRELLKRVNAEARGVLILTEGVVPYLTNDAVASLAEDLREMRRAHYWIVDYFSEKALRYRQRKRINRAMQNAPFRFRPGDWFAFFSRYGWKLKEVRYFIDEGQRLGRPIPLPRRLQLVMAVSRLFTPKRRLEAMRQFAGYTLLEQETRH